MTMTDQENKTSAPAGERKWYVVHVQSGFEDRVRKGLTQRIADNKMEERIFEILIPTERVQEVKKNKRVERERKFFPGYLLVNMILDNETYWVVKNVPGATGFLGDPKPRALPEEEVNEIRSMTEASAEGKAKPAVQFERGESVRITEGPFRHFVGVVEEVIEAKAKVKANVTIFGRPTPVELDFLQVEKM